MITRFLLTLTYVFTLSGIALADSLPIKIENAWIQALPTVAEATAAYMKIRNLGEAPLKLIGASSPIATRIEPMITTKQVRNGQEILGMETRRKTAYDHGIDLSSEGRRTREIDCAICARRSPARS